MPNIADMIERRGRVLTEAQTISTAAGELTSETRTKFTALMAEVDTLDIDIKLCERAEHEANEQRSRTANRPQPGAPDQRDGEIRSSFTNFIRTGQVERRDLTAAGQGVLIPQLFSNAIVTARKSYGEVLDMVTVLKTDNGNPLKMPYSNDTANGLVPVSVGTSVGEVDPVQTPQLLQVSDFSSGIVRVDNGLLSDAGFDVETWLRTVLLQRFYRGASGLVVNGDGGNVASLLSAYAGVGVTTSTAGKIGYADLVAAMTSLDPAYAVDSVWAMNMATLGQILQIQDGNGRPLFLAGYGDATQGFVGSILGRPVRLVTQLPNVATGNSPVLFGSFSEAYTFRMQNPGIGILRLNELYAAGFETGFVGFCRVGGIATDAGTHPVVSITVK